MRDCGVCGGKDVVGVEVSTYAIIPGKRIGYHISTCKVVIEWSDSKVHVGISVPHIRATCPHEYMIHASRGTCYINHAIVIVAHRCIEPCAVVEAVLRHYLAIIASVVFHGNVTTLNS